MDSYEGGWPLPRGELIFHHGSATTKMGMNGVEGSGKSRVFVLSSTRFICFLAE
jgi:hypothetical protein